MKTHSREHKLLAEALLKYETLDIEDVKAIMKGKKEPDKLSQQTWSKLIFTDMKQINFKRTELAWLYCVEAKIVVWLIC